MYSYMYISSTPMLYAIYTHTRTLMDINGHIPDCACIRESFRAGVLAFMLVWQRTYALTSIHPSIHPSLPACMQERHVCLHVYVHKCNLRKSGHACMLATENGKKCFRGKKDTKRPQNQKHPCPSSAFSKWRFSGPWPWQDVVLAVIQIIKAPTLEGFGPGLWGFSLGLTVEGSGLRSFPNSRMLAVWCGRCLLEDVMVETLSEATRAAIHSR